MTVLPFPPYAPDVSPFEDDQSTLIQNVFPRADGYGPVPSLSVYSQALRSACRGYFYARNNDGSITIFAATVGRLWKMNNSDFSWTPVSKVANCTISNASPGVVSLTAHGLVAGDAVVFSTTGALPTGLTVGTVYYVISAGLTANAFEVSATAGGSAINTSSAGSGTHSVTDVYTSIPAGDQWQFAQFNNFVFAVQINTAPQVFDLTSSTAFADLAGITPAGALYRGGQIGSWSSPGWARPRPIASNGRGRTPPRPGPRASTRPTFRTCPTAASSARSGAARAD